MILETAASQYQPHVRRLEDWFQSGDFELETQLGKCCWLEFPQPKLPQKLQHQVFRLAGIQTLICDQANQAQNVSDRPTHFVYDPQFVGRSPNRLSLDALQHIFS
jgi:hypothetical protein